MDPSLCPIDTPLRHRQKTLVIDQLYFEIICSQDAPGRSDKTEPYYGYSSRFSHKIDQDKYEREIIRKSCAKTDPSPTGDVISEFRKKEKGKQKNRRNFSKLFYQSRQKSFQVEPSNFQGQNQVYFPSQESDERRKKNLTLGTRHHTSISLLAQEKLSVSSTRVKSHFNNPI